MSVLIVNKLKKVFPGEKSWFSGNKPDFVAVNDISFELNEGEILGLLGPNGAGKTTTIQMLLSTLKPTSGRIEYFGQELFAHREEILAQVTFASTYVKLPSRLTAHENLEIFGRLYGIPSTILKERIRQFLTFFGLWSLRDRQAGSFSAGQSTRLMLAKAFIAHPKIVLLDEPTASLDPDVARDVHAFVLQQKREFGVSVLFTSHDMDEVTELCDRVLVLKNGGIIANSSPLELAASVSTSRIRLLIADGLKRTEQYAHEQGLMYAVSERSIEIPIDERKIADFLMGLAQCGVVYTQISIDKPTLEDYFLSIVDKKTGVA